MDFKNKNTQIMIGLAIALLVFGAFLTFSGGNGPVAVADNAKLNQSRNMITKSKVNSNGDDVAFNTGGGSISGGINMSKNDSHNKNETSDTSTKVEELDNHTEEVSTVNEETNEGND